MTTIPPDDPRLARVGYARVVATRAGTIDVVLKKTETTLGRRSKKNEADVVLGECGWREVWMTLFWRFRFRSTPQPPPHHPTGDSMNISRTHAIIRWVASNQAWELAVLGKNGVTLNGTLLPAPPDGGDPPPPGTGARLASRDVLAFGLDDEDVLEIEFLLPAEGTPMLGGVGVKAEGG